MERRPTKWYTELTTIPTRSERIATASSATSLKSTNGGVLMRVRPAISTQGTSCRRRVSIASMFWSAGRTARPLAVQDAGTLRTRGMRASTSTFGSLKSSSPGGSLWETCWGLTHRSGLPLLSEVFERLAGLSGYAVSGDVLLAADHGCPQFRYRLFLLGTRTGLPIRFPTPTYGPNRALPFRTVRERRIGLSSSEAPEGWASSGRTMDRIRRCPQEETGAISLFGSSQSVVQRPDIRPKGCLRSPEMG